jgi:hypothetical protein
MKKILIFIPAYNVESYIFLLFKQIPKIIFKKNKIHFLIINDNSMDNTQKEIIRIKKYFSYKIFVYNLKKNIGYGDVQKLAFNFSIKKNYDYAIMLHGDGQYTPKKLPEFIKYLCQNKYGAVFGSRMLNYKSALKGRMPYYKFIGNIFLTTIQNLILSSKISEFHSGYRSYDIKSLKKINYKKNTSSFHFDTQITIRFLLKKIKILEIPIPTIYGNHVSHLKSIPYGLNTLFTTIKYKLNRKKYN